MQHYKEILDKSTLKATPQRLAILKELEKSGHANIDEIYENVKSSFPSISLATIYKNIISLKEENIISEVCHPNKNKYEVAKEPHAHFICKKCGFVEDIDLDSALSEDIINKYPKATKELYIYGICKKCN